MIPFSRNRTYAPGMPIRATDTGDLQDAFVAGKHGRRTLHIAPIAGQFTNLTWSGGVLQPTAGGALGYILLQLVEGQRILALGFQHLGQNTGTAGVRLFEFTAGTNTDVAFAPAVAPAPTWMTPRVQLPTPPVVIDAGCF